MKATICDQCKKHIEGQPRFQWRGIILLNLGLTVLTGDSHKEFCSKQCAINFLTELEPK